MPNGDGYLQPGEWSRLDRPLRDLDSLIAAFADAHGAETASGGDLSLPSRIIYSGEAPVRVLEVRTNPDLTDPPYDIWIRASLRESWNPLQKKRRLAEGVPAEGIAAAFAEVAEDGWREVATWLVDDFRPRW